MDLAALPRLRVCAFETRQPIQVSGLAWLWPSPPAARARGDVESSGRQRQIGSEASSTLLHDLPIFQPLPTFSFHLAMASTSQWACEWAWRDVLSLTIC